MDTSGGNIVLLVNGVLIRDDAGVMANILQKVRGFMDTAEQLTQAITDFQASITTLIEDVEALLTQPQPAVAAAIDALHSMKTSVDAEAQKVVEAMNPPAPPEPPPAPTA